MGNSLNLNSKIKGLILKTKSASSQIGQVSYCPNCQIYFPKTATYQEYDTHVEDCLLSEPRKHKTKTQQLYEVYINNNTVSKQTSKSPNEEKRTWNKYLVNFDQQLMTLNPNQIQNRTTAQKIIWLNHHLQEEKVDWEDGAEHLMFSPNNIVVDSLLILKLNLLKELKLTVVDDIVKDAGGLLREWSVLLLKELIGSYGLFKVNKSGSYMLQPSEGEFDELYELIGALLAKIILERVTIPIHFDYSFLAQLTGNLPCLEDIQTFDKQLFSSWKSILEVEKVEELELTFTILCQGEEKQLLPNGNDVKVTNKNKHLFVERCIDAYCIQKIQREMLLIKKRFNQYIPDNVIEVLKPSELEMILNGVDSANISIEDWQKGTEYRQPYKEDHKVIKWFWNLVSLMNATEKSRLLKFVTGSQNLPIFGFKHLETNRGKTSCFVIEGCKYQKKKCFPKAHTCFNRLILPVYPSQEALAQALFPVIRSEFDGVWGLQ